MQRLPLLLQSPQKSRGFLEPVFFCHYSASIWNRCIWRRKQARGTQACGLCSYLARCVRAKVLNCALPHWLIRVWRARCLARAARRWRRRQRRQVMSAWYLLMRQSIDHRNRAFALGLRVKLGTAAGNLTVWGRVCACSAATTPTRTHMRIQRCYHTHPHTCTRTHTHTHTHTHTYTHTHTHTHTKEKVSCMKLKRKSIMHET